MRRRQINQLRAAGLLPPVSAHLRPVWEAQHVAVIPEPPQAPEKGTCRKCGLKVGRGVHFHERSCNGNAGHA